MNGHVIEDDQGVLEEDSIAAITGPQARRMFISWNLQAYKRSKSCSTTAWWVLGGDDKAVEPTAKERTETKRILLANSHGTVPCIFYLLWGTNK